MEKNYLDMLMDDHSIIEKCLVILDMQVAKGEKMNLKIIRTLMDILSDYGDLCHNAKEEKIYFPLLLDKGLPPQGPVSVMIKEHELEREFIDKIYDELNDIEAKKKIPFYFKSMVNDYTSLTKNHVWKENDILYPMGKRILSDVDESYLAAEFLKIENDTSGPDGYKRYLILTNAVEKQSGEKIDLLATVPTDVLTHMIDALPIELSFVDADDRVRYFSKVEEKKIFPRTLGVVGRTVQQCHPKKSVHLVNKIISEMKQGTREKATFWLPIDNMFVHISYFAVRDANGKYEGCVEMVQDIKPYRDIAEDKRLLDDE